MYVYAYIHEHDGLFTHPALEICMYVHVSDTVAVM